MPQDMGNGAQASGENPRAVPSTAHYHTSKALEASTAHVTAATTAPARAPAAVPLPSFAHDLAPVRMYPGSHLAHTQAAWTSHVSHPVTSHSPELEAAELDDSAAGDVVVIGCSVA
ncbi:hypothetical protein NESM_000306500 [Novymonas esmeraldas]|uniref:Uncharacterized protein n=1 Tax=Novymonas esmeraldas TaxID=1808958 RepID=A0AAW0F746_9TRYP